jgi:dihydrodipicolinate reductase
VHVLSRDRSQTKRTMVVKVAISGAAGRMGRRLMSLAVADPDVELVQALEYAAHPLMGKVFT